MFDVLVLEISVLEVRMLEPVIPAVCSQRLKFVAFWVGPQDHWAWLSRT